GALRIHPERVPHPGGDRERATVRAQGRLRPAAKTPPFRCDPHRRAPRLWNQEKSQTLRAPPSSRARSEPARARRDLLLLAAAGAFAESSSARPTRAAPNALAARHPARQTIREHRPATAAPSQAIFLAARSRARRLPAWRQCRKRPYVIEKEPPHDPSPRASTARSRTDTAP